MILVDTNVWVRSVSGKFPALTQHLRTLVHNGDVRGHEFVFGELLLIPGGAARKAMVDRYRDIEHLEVLPSEAINAFILKHQLTGKGVGLVDAHLIAAAHNAGARLWTEEKAARAIAGSLGIGYEPDKPSP